MIFASFYTDNGRYPALAKRLEASLLKFHLTPYIERMPDKGEWNKTCQQKARFVLDLLDRFHKPIVWMDCDTTVCQYPELLFDPQYDFAAYNWRADPDNLAKFSHQPEVLAVSGGVMKFGNTDAAKQLLLMWEQRMAKGDLLDDPSLDAVYNGCRPPVNPLWLPRAYNRMDGLFPETKPVIDHEYRGGTHRETR